MTYTDDSRQVLYDAFTFFYFDFFMMNPLKTCEFEMNNIFLFEVIALLLMFMMILFQLELY